MDDNVILHIGEKRFLLTQDEAMTICSTLNSASRIERAWIKDVISEKSNVIKPPDYSSFITPMTVLLHMEVTQNMKTLEDKR
jgi:hypothetical protein